MLGAAAEIENNINQKFVVQISNLDDLGRVYGRGLTSHVRSVVISRLQRLGLSVRTMNNDCSMFIASQNRTSLNIQKYDDIKIGIISAVSKDPVAWGIKLIYLRVEVQPLENSLGGMGKQPNTSNNSVQPPRLSVEIDHNYSWRSRYQDQMYLASRLFEDLKSDRLVLALQAVATREISEGDPALYYECLLRQKVSDSSSRYDLPEAVQALKYLGLVERLDRSVIWAVLGVLRSCKEIHLGCNVSSRSFVRASWWDEMLEYLQDHPELARRLILEISENGLFSENKNALKILKHLKFLGVRIALDKIEMEAGSLDILNKVHANIVKFDKSVLGKASIGIISPRMLRNMVSICAEHGLSVIVEGVDSTEKLNLALTSGVTGVQGDLVGGPQLRVAGFLDDVIQLKDRLVFCVGSVHKF